jgi:hypothetical protein
MKLSLFERGIACCLFGAATMAIATGMSKVAPPSAADEARFAALDGNSADEDPPDDFDVSEEPNEQSIGKLVEAAAQASTDEKEEKRSALKEALSQVFRKRAEAQQARIGEMRQRLEAIESQLEKRMSLEEQIVERRLGQLLGEKDELSWDHEPALDLGPIGKTGHANHWSDLSYSFEFPKEFPIEVPLDGFDKNLKLHRNAERLSDARDAMLNAKRGAEQAEKQAADAERKMRDFREAREKSMQMQERLRTETKKDLLNKLQPLDSLRENLNLRKDLLEKAHESHMRGKGDEAASLKALLENMRDQTKQIEKQLEEVSKKKPRNAEPL